MASKKQIDEVRNRGKRQQPRETSLEPEIVLEIQPGDVPPEVRSSGDVEQLLNWVNRELKKLKGRVK